MNFGNVAHEYLLWFEFVFVADFWFSWHRPLRRTLVRVNYILPDPFKKNITTFFNNVKFMVIRGNCS